MNQYSERLQIAINAKRDRRMAQLEVETQRCSAIREGVCPDCYKDMRLVSGPIATKLLGHKYRCDKCNTTHKCK